MNGYLQKKETKKNTKTLSVDRIDRDKFVDPLPACFLVLFL